MVGDRGRSWEIVGDRGRWWEISQLACSCAASSCGCAATRELLGALPAAAAALPLPLVIPLGRALGRALDCALAFLLLQNWRSPARKRAAASEAWLGLG